MNEINTSTEQTMTRYLLGDASEQECVAVEDKFLRDPEYLKQLRAVESELIDDYVCGALPERDRLHFERMLSRTPQRRERVIRARRMMNALDLITAENQAQEKVMTTPAPVFPARSLWQTIAAWFTVPRLAMQYGLAAVALLLLLGGVWLLREGFSTRQELARLQAERETLHQAAQEAQKNEQSLQEQLAAQQSAQQQIAEQLRQEQARSEQLQHEVRQARSASAGAEQNFVALALTSGIDRSSDTPRKLVIPQGVREIRLQLEVDAAQRYRSYQAELTTGGGSQVWHQSGLTAQTADWGRYVMVKIPARALIQSEYELTLRGVATEGKREVAGYYYFIATPQPQQPR